MIKFRFNPLKAMEAIEWMLARAQAPVNFQTLLKAAYFADKQMLNQYGRPVFGAEYRALNYGPVPHEIYEMLKGEPYWLSELEREVYPWELVSAYRVKLRDGVNRQPELDNIAPAEMTILRDAFEKSQAMSFTQRTRETHGMDWVEGTRRAGERMAYEDMIAPDLPNRIELIQELQAMGPRLVL